MEDTELQELVGAASSKRALKLSLQVAAREKKERLKEQAGRYRRCFWQWPFGHVREGNGYDHSCLNCGHRIGWRNRE